MEDSSEQATHLTEYQLSIVADAMEDGRIDEVDSDIRFHLEECLECKHAVLELVENMTAMHQSFSNTTSPEPRKIERYSVNVRWIAAAATVLLFLSIVFSLYQRNRYESEIALIQGGIKQGTPTKTAEQTSMLDSLEEAIYNLKVKQNRYIDSVASLEEKLILHNDLLAQLYAPNPELEEEMSILVRSDYVEVIEPHLRSRVQNGFLTFEWKESNQVLDLLIYSNKGLRVIHQNQIKNMHKQSVSKLAPGLYYYELFRGDEMVAMGKFQLKPN
ncbi:MAG: hypothetical protein JJ975_00660 [Bacteroidia bacterium]|nr:hypothetical protein [Bacteroidia bacterium]